MFLKNLNGRFGQRKDYNMHDYQYVSKRQASPIRKEIETLIHLVQKEVRTKFTFSYQFIGSASRNMITEDKKSNTGFDFDVNIRVNDDDNDYTPKQIKTTLMTAFNKYNHLFQYDNCEDSKRVITIKVKDTKNSTILHSCDFAVVNDYVDDDGYDCQEFIYFNKNQNTYEWQEQPKSFYELPEKIEWCHNEGLWNAVRVLYIMKKNSNSDPHVKSRSIFAKTVHEICQKYGYFKS